MHYVYIIKSRKAGKLYIGYTQDLRQRFREHNEGKSSATKHYASFDLIYYEAYRSKQDALKREAKLKHYKQAYTRLKERILNSIKGQN